MDKALISLVLLKYNILTSDRNTWHLCDTYPKEARAKWAWRCTADVEYFTKGHPEAEKCIEVAKKFRDGMATEEELADAAITAMRHTSPTAAISMRSAANSAYAFYHAALGGCAARHAAQTAYYAVHYAHNAAEEQARKWDLYLSWLIEELCAWEQAPTSREVMVDR